MSKCGELFLKEDILVKRKRFLLLALCFVIALAVACDSPYIDMAEVQAPNYELDEELDLENIEYISNIPVRGSYLTSTDINLVPIINEDEVMDVYIYEMLRVIRELIEMLEPYIEVTEDDPFYNMTSDEIIEQMEEELRYEVGRYGVEIQLVILTMYEVDSFLAWEINLGGFEQYYIVANGDNVGALVDLTHGFSDDWELEWHDDD